MEMTLLGNLDPALLQNFFGTLRTTEVVVTEERVAHIKERHRRILLYLNSTAQKQCFSPIC